MVKPKDKLRDVTIPNAMPLVKVIERAMMDKWRESKTVSFDLDAIARLIEPHPANRGTISATLSHMLKRNVAMAMPKMKGYNGRMVNCYALVSVMELATEPEKPSTEKPKKESANSGPSATVEQYRPTKNVKHVDRPPINSLSKEEFERKASTQDRESGTEKTATGDDITSVAASSFTHWDGNVASGQMTTSRDPRKPQDPEAIAEMVQHIANTAVSTKEEGKEMTTPANGKIRQGTVEYDFAQLDKRIGRLENLLDRAIGGVDKANREGIVKQDAANSAMRQIIENFVNEINSRAGARNAKSLEAMNEFIDKLNDNNEIYRTILSEMLTLYVDSATQNKTNIRLTGQIVESNGILIDELRNSALVEARAFVKGYDQAKAEFADENKAKRLADTITATDSANEAAIRADEIARRLGITNDADVQAVTDTITEATESGVRAIALNLSTGQATDIMSGADLN